MKKKSKFPPLSRGRSKKVWLITKFCLLFVLLGAMTVHATAYSQTDGQISLQMKNATLGEILVALEKKTTVKFMYDRQDVQNMGRINVAFENKSIGEILTYVCGARD